VVLRHRLGFLGGSLVAMAISGSGTLRKRTGLAQTPARPPSGRLSALPVLGTPIRTPPGTNWPVRPPGEQAVVPGSAGTLSRYGQHLSPPSARTAARPSSATAAARTTS